jgi:hypothetical protein
MLNYKPPQIPKITLGAALNMLNDAAADAHKHIDDYLKNGYMSSSEHQSHKAIIDFTKMKMQDKLYAHDKRIRPHSTVPCISTIRRKKK